MALKSNPQHMQNLRSLGDLPEKERKEIQRRGGINSGKTRRRKRDLAQTLDIILSMKLNDERLTDLESIKQFKDLANAKKNPTAQDAVLAALVAKAMKGNVLACELIMNILGENPTVKVDAEASVDSELKVTVDYGDTDQS